MPNPWPKVPLGEVLTQYEAYIDAPEPREYPKLSVKLHGKGVTLDTPADGASLKMQRHQIAKSGQVILSEIWGKKGAIGFVPPEGDGALCTSHFFLFDLRKERVDQRYLQAVFTANYLADQLDEQAKGTTGYAAVRPKNLFACKIPLPPLDEQRRILARIEQLAAKIQEASRLRAEASVQSEGCARAAASKILAQVGTAPTRLDSWLDTTCGGIQTGPFGAQLGSSDFVETGVPLLTIGNVQFGGLDIRNVLHVTNEKASDLARYRVVKGDILFARMGTVGRCCIVPPEADGSLINYHIIRVRPDTIRVDPRYIHWSIQASAEVEAYLEDKIRGATRQGVNSGIVAGLPCRVPSVPEQRRIVAHLDKLQAKVDALKRLQAETAAELDALLPSILDKAFKGEL